MHSCEFVWQRHEGLRVVGQGALPSDADLVVFFGSPARLREGVAFTELRERYARAQIVGCSGNGHFGRRPVEPDVISGIIVRFEKSNCRVASVPIPADADGRPYGAALGRALKAPDLRCVFLLACGTRIDPAGLVNALGKELGAAIPISGGFAADDNQFVSTAVVANGPADERLVAAIGFYGDALTARTAFGTGWSSFGVKRVVTRASGRTLYELDGEPAYDVCAHYLGEKGMAALPGSALTYPIRIAHPDHPGEGLIRQLIGADPVARSLTFGADVPTGWTAQLVRGTFELLTEGARKAAEECRPRGSGDSLSLIASCVGRKMVMGQHIIDEVDATAAVLAPTGAMAGFYSFGEIAADAPGRPSQYLNQSIAVLSLQES